MRVFGKQRPRYQPQAKPAKPTESTGSGRHETKRHVPHHRLIALLAIMGIFFGILLLRLGWEQIVRVEDYREAEARQNYRRILMPGPRGNIYDREGRLLVGNRPVFNAVVSLNELRSEFRQEYARRADEKREIQQKINRLDLNEASRRAVVQRYLDQLNRLLGRAEQVNSQQLERHFRQSLLLPFTLIADLAPEEYAALIEQIPVESPIQVVAESARHYPFGAAASHALGFVSSTDALNPADVPGEDLLTFTFEGKVGRSGLERVFDEQLQGRSGGEIWSVDPGGFQYEQIAYRSPVKGNDIVTTLDIDLQLAAERALAGKIGAVVALRVSNGEVLALASLPNFDLNDLSPFLSHAVNERITDEGGWLNRATNGLYPPGSTFKLVTAMAGLRAGLIEEDTEIDCPGFFLVGRRSFKCHRHSGHGVENLVEAIRDSCNVFFYDRGIAMGPEAIATEARRFGFGEPTGVEVFGETNNMIVPDPAWKRRRFDDAWFNGDTANFSIGQGFLLTTPMQVASFAASLARGETLTPPTLILHQRPSPEKAARIDPIDLPPRAFGLILEGMRAAGRDGTARLASSTSGIAVAGKTGTAQVRKDGRPTTLAWFMGFAPADAPQIAIAVMVEGVPAEETAYGGGSTAGPIAGEVLRVFAEKQRPRR